MKLYLLKQNIDRKLAYDSIIVCAESETEAIKINPFNQRFISEIDFKPSEEYSSYKWYLYDWGRNWCPNPSYVRCIELGTANKDIEAGVVSTSFKEE